MIIEELEIANSPEYFQAGDYLSKKEYVLFGNDKTIIRNGNILKTELPFKISMPQITIIDNTSFLISEYDTHSSNLTAKSKNAWLIDEKGKILSHFNIGHAYKIVSTEKFIIASYARSDFYRGVSSEFEVGGFAVFDFKGNCLFHFDHVDAIFPKQMKFIDIKAMSIFDNNKVHFLTYPNFDILKLDLNNFKLDVELQLNVDKTNVDDEFWNPKAISKFGSEWFFLTPHGETNESIIFKRGEDNKVVKIGSCNYSPFPKGLLNGKFLIPSFSIDETAKKCQIVKCKYAA